MALTELRVRTAKPQSKPYKLSDVGGLFLLVAKQGGKLWRYSYRFDGKQKTLALGGYPDTGLKDAREKHAEARKLLAKGIDPSENRKAVKASRTARAANSFEVIAREWFAMKSASWSDSHGERIIRRLERDIFPWIGSKPIADLTAPELLSALRRIESRSAIETAHRALQNCGQVLRYAVASGRASRDFSGDLRGALAPPNEKNLAAITKPSQVGPLLRALDSYEGTFVVKCALRLAPLVFVRPGELRQAEWKHFDLENSEWCYFVKKTQIDLIVPLSRQAMEILTEIKALTGDGKYVFPGARSNSRPMSDNAVLAAMRRMGIAKDEMCGHGFRAMARTILDEVLGVRVDLIEHQLAHAVIDPNGRAYNRTAHLVARKKMMQQWADYLDNLRNGTKRQTYTPNESNMKIYFDCEFTDISLAIGDIKLISAGFVAEDGRELYFELMDNFQLGECSSFVHDVVLPHLDSSKYGLLSAQAAEKLKDWIEAFQEPVILVSDAPEYDWSLVFGLLSQHKSMPANLKLSPQGVSFENIDTAINNFFAAKLMSTRHHALWDARALAHVSTDNVLL
jgi:integrase